MHSNRQSALFPEVTEFSAIFPEFTFEKSRAPSPRQWSVRRPVRTRSYVENIPVGPECTVAGNMICYVRCSDEVFAMIDRRLGTPEKNDHVRFEVLPLDSATALAVARSSYLSLPIARIDSRSIPRP